MALKFLFQICQKNKGHGIVTIKDATIEENNGGLARPKTSTDHVGLTPPFAVCLLVFCLELPFPLHPLILAAGCKTEKQRVIKMEYGRLPGVL